jgi:hypothetical protein
MIILETLVCRRCCLSLVPSAPSPVSQNILSAAGLFPSTYGEMLRQVNAKTDQMPHNSFLTYSISFPVLHSLPRAAENEHISGKLLICFL